MVSGLSYFSRENDVYIDHTTFSHGFPKNNDVHVVSIIITLSVLLKYHHGITTIWQIHVGWESLTLSFFFSLPSTYQSTAEKSKNKFWLEELRLMLFHNVIQGPSDVWHYNFGNNLGLL